MKCRSLFYWSRRWFGTTLVATFVTTLMAAIGGCASSSLPIKSSLNADFDYAMGGYFSQQTEQNAGARVDTTLRWKKSAKIKLTPLLQWEWQGGGTLPLQRDRFFYDLPEGYLQLQQHPITLQVGYNTVTWGVTDGFNPLDVVSPRNYYDPLRSAKLGTPSLTLRADVTSFLNFEVIYIPLQRKSRLPSSESRWLPTNTLKSRSVASDGGNATLLFPDPPQYTYLPDQELDRALSNNFGIRMQTSPFSGLDLSVVAFEGAAGTPAMNLSMSGTVVALDPELIIRADPQVGLSPVYYRQRMTGFSAVYAWRDFIFRGEAAITNVLSQRQDLPGRSVEAVFGIEHGVLVWNNLFTLLAQATSAQHSEGAENVGASLSRIFDRSLILGVRFAPNEKWNFVGSLLHDTAYKGKLWHGETLYSLSDALKASLALDILSGEPGTPLGTYDLNDRAILGLKYRL